MLAGGVFVSANVSLEVKSLINEVVSREVGSQEIGELIVMDSQEIKETFGGVVLDQNNVAIYKIESSEKPLYVISLSENSLNLVENEEESITRSTSYLSFGLDGSYRESSFLKNSGGVFGSKEKGYVMLGKGSISGISTSVEILESVDNSLLEILIYKNGEVVGLRNVFVEEGVLKDYDVYSFGVISYEPGDVISIYASSYGLVYKDVITLLEIQEEH